MKKMIKTVALGSAMALATVAAQPALAAKSAPAAPSDGGTIIPGLAVANLDAVVANSNAYKTAEQQRETTYKAQYDQAKARNDQLTAQIKPMVDKFNADRQAANPNQASLQQQAAAIQQLQEKGKAELQQILQPVAMSQAYVQEQIEDKLNDALKAAMKKRNVSMVLSPDSVIAFNGAAYNLNQDILNELNTAIPSAQLVPPSGWEPRQVREARAQQAAAEGAQQSTSTQPTGR
ncbi:membrane protein [Novosphingobium malaysiense]|uniref:Membrane protein n=2 Tax=Novosphingobium malaysiense TaxID=1348853 RepID=A0A0B1ZIZ4_9SPHN|nr:membrane protein [Novosphingobium malaysiense]